MIETLTGPGFAHPRGRYRGRFSGGPWMAGLAARLIADIPRGVVR